MIQRVRTQRQVCVYIDILGGAQLYQNKDKNRAELFFQCVREFERRLNGWLHHFPKRRKNSVLVKTFSDNVVAAFPFNSNRLLSDSALVALVLTELKQQLFELTVLASFPVRGAVTVGPLTLTDDVIYGAALVDAVKLEKEALFPRILLSESTLKYLRNTMYESLVVRDRDGKSFLHYLDNPCSFDLHREFVLDGLKENSGYIHERQKYEWLAQYHNFAARQLGRPEFCVSLEREDAFTLCDRDAPLAWRKFHEERTAFGDPYSEAGGQSLDPT